MIGGNNENTAPLHVGQGRITFPRLTGAQVSWFALYVQANHEKDVAIRLEEKSIGCFLPLMECWSKRRDRRRRIQLPLFRGYVFLHTLLNNYSILHILKTPGALSILKNSEGPLPIPDYQIENLQTALRSGLPVTHQPYMEKGVVFRVIHGPMTGCVGMLLHENHKKGRLVIGVDILRQSVSVELDLEDVEPVEPAPIPETYS